MRFNQEMVLMGTIKKTYEKNEYYKGIFYDKDTGENYDFYLNDDMVNYLKTYDVLSTHVLTIQIYKRINDKGVTLNCFRLLDIDGLCEVENEK